MGKVSDQACWHSKLTFLQNSENSLSYRMVTEKWMDIQVGDIIKLENNQAVTVSTSLGCGFFSFGLSRNSFNTSVTAFSGDLHLPHFASRDQ